MSEAPRDWSSKDAVEAQHEHPRTVDSRSAVIRLDALGHPHRLRLLWGMPQVKAFLDGIWVAKFPVAGLHELVQKVPPVVAEPHPKPRYSSSTCSRRPAPAFCSRRSSRA